MASPTTEWPEAIALLALITATILAIFSETMTTVYAICFLTGLMFGKLWHKHQQEERTAVAYAIIAFFIGITITTLLQNVQAITIATLAGIITGYWLYEKKIID